MDIDKVPSNLLKAKKYLIKIDEYCEKLNITKNELALSFVDTIATESLMLFGCDNISQAKDNISTYNRLKFLDKNIILNMIDDFKNIDEDIYNPTKWNV
jgi:aryl-alcohol dehydrogenase-like predicted oxidoreductase